jgi:hypothetical protein
MIVNDAPLRERLGRAARARVLSQFMPQQYAQSVAAFMASGARPVDDRPVEKAARA